MTTKLVLSKQARSALISVGTNRQGAVVHPNLPAGVLKELRDADLIGRGYGLTRKGSIERERIVDAMMDDLF